MKKGQFSRIFIFLFAIIVIGVLAIIGAKVFRSINSHSSMAQIEAFESELSQSLSGIGFGVMKQHTIGCPGDMVCFWDSENNLSGYPKDYNSLLLDEMLNQYNVFVIKRNNILGQFNVQNIRVTEQKSLKCFNTGFGFLKINVRGGEYGKIFIEEI